MADVLREQIKTIEANNAGDTESDRRTAEAARRNEQLLLAAAWFNPVASDKPKPLTPGTNIKLVLWNGTELDSKTVQVTQPATFRDFPQRVSLEAPE